MGLITKDTITADRMNLTHLIGDKMTGDEAFGLGKISGTFILEVIERFRNAKNATKVSPERAVIHKKLKKMKAIPCYQSQSSLEFVDGITDNSLEIDRQGSKASVCRPSSGASGAS